MGVVISAAKATTPRRYFKKYVHGWSETYDELYAHFLGSGDRERADKLLHSIDRVRRQKWTEPVENLDFKQLS